MTLRQPKPTIVIVDDMGPADATPAMRKALLCWYSRFLANHPDAVCLTVYGTAAVLKQPTAS